MTELQAAKRTFVFRAMLSALTIVFAVLCGLFANLEPDKKITTIVALVVISGLSLYVGLKGWRDAQRRALADAPVNEEADADDMEIGALADMPGKEGD